MSACLLIQTIFSRSTRTKRRSVSSTLRKSPCIMCEQACKHRPVASAGGIGPLRAAEHDDSSPPAVTNQSPCAPQGSPPQCACVRGRLWLKAQPRGDTESSNLSHGSPTLTSCCFQQPALRSMGHFPVCEEN